MVATQTNTSEVCDRCLNPRRRKLTTYTAGKDGFTVRIVLCQEHSRIMDDMMARGKVVPSASPQVKVWDFDEIQAMKKARKQKNPSRPRR